MVKLRLTRMGSINKPFYRVVAVDSRARRDGKYLDNIGYYDPKHNPAVIKLDEEKAIKWLKVGAQPTETVVSLFRKAGILKKWHEMRYGNKEKTEGGKIEEVIPENTKPKKTKEKKEKVVPVNVVENTQELSAPEEELVEASPEPLEETVETIEDSESPVHEEVVEENIEVETEQDETVVEKDALEPQEIQEEIVDDVKKEIETHPTDEPEIQETE